MNSAPALSAFENSIYERIQDMSDPARSPARAREYRQQHGRKHAKHTDLRHLQTETDADLSAFTPVLLAKAFRGEL